MFRERLALARQRLSVCNYFLAGLALTIAAGWDEIRPLLHDLLTAFVPDSMVNPILAALGILVILVRGGWALRPPAGGPGTGSDAGGPR